MSSRVKSSAAARRPTVNQNGSAQQQRHFRRAAPYTSRELKSEDLKDALDSYEELQQLKFESYKHQPSAKPDASTPSDRRKALYQKFYRQVQEERKPADCVVLSIANQCLDYPKSLRQCLQERGLSVEMLYLQAETDLTRALQDVRADGSLLCILVEQTNIALSSCTIIIFSESLKIHRNMPKDQAMDFVVAEHSRGLANERPQRDPADIAAQASQLLDDFLDREKIDRHCIPCDTRPLLMLLAEGVHLYSEELETIVDYVRSRQDQIQATSTEGERGNLLPPGLGKPPPLLPTPPGPPQPQSTADAGMIEHTLPTRPPLLPSPVSYPKTKPPPLLSLHRPPGLSLGDLSSRGPLSSHIPYGLPGRLRGPLLPSPFHPGTRGPGGIRGAPPSLKSYRPLFHSSPVAPLLRPSGPRH